MTFFKNLIYTITAITFTIHGWAAETSAEIHTSNNHTMTNSGAALSSSSIADTPFLFQTGFNSATWSGNLRKTGISQHVDGNLVISQEVLWDAGILLSTLQAPAQRTITTYNPVIKQTVAFELGQLSADIQSLFHIFPGTKINDASGAARVSYLRGERTMESKNANPAIPQFRVRDSILGDIIHSAPVYVGAPAKNMTGPSYSSQDYLSFYDQHKKRPGTVFVGANDGMLHAFSADSGAEFFAYIPSPLLKKLPKLTDPAYQHEPMMDGNLHVSEAQVAGQWRTVLAAGMGHGAKGVFALDVTVPDQFMTGKRALFEFTEQDDEDIGYITSSPSIAKISIGKNKNGSPNYKYFVAVSSGYNPADTNSANTGNQFLFLLSLDKDPTTPWFKNSNYYKLSTNSNDASTGNAISAPGLVLNAQGAAIYAYSGDLQGNLWRFDFTGDKPDSITPLIIFTAKDKENNPQSITAQPTVSFAPGGGYLILFGTGENTNSTKDHLKQNSFYAIRDTKKEKKDDYFITSRSQLAARVLVAATIKGKSGVQVTGHDFSYDNSASNKKGWYVDYNSNHSENNQCGERSMSKAVLAFGSIFFNTIIPGGALCDEGGTSISYAINAMTGKPDDTNNLTGSPSQAGMLGAPYPSPQNYFQATGMQPDDVLIPNIIPFLMWVPEACMVHLK